MTLRRPPFLSTQFLLVLTGYNLLVLVTVLLAWSGLEPVWKDWDAKEEARSHLPRGRCGLK